MEVIILAGGIGSRLKDVLRGIPKPMAPVDETPFLEFVLKYLKAQSVDRVILATGYNSQVISDYFGLNYDGIEIVYSKEDEPLGTGGAIKQAIRHTLSEYFFIINGDTLFKIDLKRMTESFVAESRLMLALKAMRNFDRYGSVQMNQKGFVTSFLEKKFRQFGLINGGVYLVRKNLFEEFPLPKRFSFEEFLEREFINLSTTCMTFNSYFIDIGVPEDLERARNEL